MKDTELTRKWIAALRSGKYNQGRCYLRSKTDHFCCLGVLCDLYYPDGWEDTDVDNNRSWYRFNGLARFSAADTHPPQEVMKLVGMNLYEQLEIVAMNDYENYSFEELASAIEEVSQS